MNSTRHNPYGRGSNDGGGGGAMPGGSGITSSRGRTHQVVNDPRLPRYGSEGGDMYAQTTQSGMPPYNGYSMPSQQQQQQQPPGQYMMNAPAAAMPNVNYPNSYTGLPPAPLSQMYNGMNQSQPGQMVPSPSMQGSRPPRTNQKVALGNPDLMAREQKCRALFVRNVKFNADIEHIRRLFEECGEVKTFFSMVENRGIVFVTFYDIRGADLAKNRIQGTLIENRPIDVHYSLPKDDEQEQRCDRDKNQGTLFVTLRHHPESHRIRDEDYHNWFSQFGELIKIRTYKGHPDQRFVEFYDSRACVLAHDKSIEQPYLGGKWDCKFAWDNPTKGKIQGGPSRDQAGPPRGVNQIAREPGRFDRGYSNQLQDGNAAQGSFPYQAPMAMPAQAPGAPYNGGDADARARLEQAQKVQQMLQGLSGNAALAAPPSIQSQPPQQLYSQYYAPSPAMPPGQSQAASPAPPGGLDYNLLQNILAQTQAQAPSQPPPQQQQQQHSTTNGSAYTNFNPQNPAYRPPTYPQPATGQPPLSAGAGVQHPQSSHAAHAAPSATSPSSAPQMQQLLALLSQQQKK